LKKIAKLSEDVEFCLPLLLSVVTLLSFLTQILDLKRREQPAMLIVKLKKALATTCFCHLR